MLHSSIIINFIISWAPRKRASQPASDSVHNWTARPSHPTVHHGFPRKLFLGKGKGLYRCRCASPSRHLAPVPEPWSTPVAKAVASGGGQAGRMRRHACSERGPYPGLLRQHFPCLLPLPEPLLFLSELSFRLSQLLLVWVGMALEESRSQRNGPLLFCIFCSFPPGPLSSRTLFPP